MKKKICIIGAGLFGTSIYLKLKKKFDCYIFDEKKDILLGASTNNLNRVHLGYHYPRDEETVKQSYEGFKSFKKEFKNSIRQGFNNYYLIADRSNVSFEKYINFCKKNNLYFKIITKKNFKLDLENIEGGISVNEPIYDWRIIKDEIKKKFSSFDDNKLFLNYKVTNIIPKKDCYEIITSNKKFTFDIIINTSYHNINSLVKKKYEEKDYKFQLITVFNFNSKKLKNTGIAVMDGKFFSFLPNGFRSDHILYDVEHSVLKEKVTNKFNNNWLKTSNINQIIQDSRVKSKNKIEKYIKNVDINFTNKYFLSPRVILPNVEKTDKRISKIINNHQNYYTIFSAKVDHSIDIANKLYKMLVKL